MNEETKNDEKNLFEDFDVQEPYVIKETKVSAVDKQQRKEIGLKLAFAGIGSVLFFVLFLFFFAVNARFVFGGEPQDVMQAIEKGEFVKDEHVTVNVNAVLENYAFTRHRINGIIPIGTDQHYMIRLENNAIVSLKVKNKRIIHKLDDIQEKTWDCMNGYSKTLPAGVKIQGRISTIHPEVEGYYSTVLSFLGLSDSDIPIYYVEIDTTETKGKAIVEILLLFALSVACVFSALQLYKKMKQSK